jgi:hypothetical protein
LRATVIPAPWKHRAVITVGACNMQVHPALLRVDRVLMHRVPVPEALSIGRNLRFRVPVQIMSSI